MNRFFKCIISFVGILSVSACVTSVAEERTYINETLRFDSTSRGEVKPVVAMIAIPINATGPFPVIITQHGSSRDGMVFPGGGRTDEYSTRLITKGTKRGFAVVAIDAFYQSSIKPEDKRKFPNAHQYALDLKTLLVSDPRFDGANMFYTGFSYGAGQVNKSVDTLTEYNSTPWRAVAAAEPGCNIISEPVRVPFPFLLIKGSESHYYIEPCLYFAHLLRAAGVKVTLSVIDGANHFFSTNGQITKGVAVNGCRFNPVIRMKNRTLQFADGSPASRLLIRQRCITSEGGSGKNRFLLDGAIEQVLDFFVLHQSKEKVIE